MSSPATNEGTDPYRWPVLRRYGLGQLRRIALPLGGIGTGTISLGGRGDLRDWEVVNRPAKGYTPERAFFALRVADAGGRVVQRALEGPIDPADYEGAHGSPVPNHGLARFRAAAFETAYPLGQVVLSDPDVPVAVRLQAFNPLVPTDPETSGIPVAVLRYVVRNPAPEPVTVTVCGSLPNVIGTDGSNGTARGNRNRVRTGGALSGVFLEPGERLGTDAEQYGTMALAAVTHDGDRVSHRTDWVDRTWNGGLLDFWDDLADDGELTDRTSTRDAPTASVAVTRQVPAGATVAFTFLVCWRFPNRLAWDAAEGTDEPWTTTGDVVGNHYATRWPDAWQVAVDVADRLPALEDATVDFVRSLVDTELPEPVVEAALFNLSTLRTQTCFRTADGHFFGWEGCSDRVGSCVGSCTHVWNYEPATAHLFGSLARDMREIEFGHATDERGLMSFRILQPLETRAQAWGLAAADGQMGCLVKLYREWRLSGDDEFLRRLWPAARRALEFCWIPGGWDADCDGVMEGCQHNTMDVEYYGPNPQMGGWYLAALRAMARMARHVGEDEFADRCTKLADNGAAVLDRELFNGEYYRQRVIAPGDESALAPGLRHPDIGARDLTDPDLQIGDGCLVDQLVGQALAHQNDLGHLLDPGHVATALSSVLRYNRQQGWDDHFNPMRSYVLGDERALLMCGYPDGTRPARPFPYFGEVMTGFEYTAAVGLAYEGRIDDAVEVVADIRARYDGWRRNPFDEAECGHHYARAMASWGMVLALTGFGYAAAERRMRLRGRPGARWFWATGDAWGTSTQRRDGATAAVEIRVHGGELPLSTVELTGLAECRLPEPTTLRAGESATLTGPVR